MDDHTFLITILGHPPSVNAIWRKGKDRLGKTKFYKVKEYTEWEHKVFAACLSKGLAKWKLQKNKLYELEIEVQAPTWITKKGTPKKPDVTNLIKAAEDAVCKVFDWQDSYCTKCTITKVSGPQHDKCTVIKFIFN